MPVGAGDDAGRQAVVPVVPVVDGRRGSRRTSTCPTSSLDEDVDVGGCAGVVAVAAAALAPPTVSERKSMPALRAAVSSWKTSDAASSSAGTALPSRATVA